MGVECFKYYEFDGMEILVKPLSDGNLAVLFLNRSDRSQTVNFDWAAHMIQDKISNTDVDFSKTSYKLRDLWVHKDVGTTQKAFRQTIASHDVIMLKLTK
jgi:alpha-galactosidase